MSSIAQPYWNWQQPDWPRFHWDSTRFVQSEERFLVNAGELAGVLRHFPAPEREQLIVEALGDEALTTSEIEGEVLDRASVQSSIRREFGLGADRRRSTEAEQGIAEMMVSLYRSFGEPLSQEMLFSWHGKLFRSGGGYRTGSEPMEVVSGPSYARKVHFEAPPSDRVAAEMDRFMEWFHRTRPAGIDPLPAVTRAGIAHLYFESIHPFEDGNGRIGRAISEKVLAEGAGRPGLTALASAILVRRRAYCDALQAASKGNEVTPWLEWFAATTMEAQRRAIEGVESVLAKTRLLDRLRGHLNPRQEKTMMRMLREGPAGFAGGLSAGNYATITGASPATATRDLADLVAKGALRKRGELRHTRYEVAI